MLLAIPSLDLQSRRTLISKLEEIKIAVRTVPAFHELVFDSKKCQIFKTYQLMIFYLIEELMILK